MKDYDVLFKDGKNEGYNHKIISAETAGDIIVYMKQLGHTEIVINERK